MNNINLNTAVFTTANMKPNHGASGNRQWMNKIVNNTGYLWRRTDLGIELWNEYFTNGQEKTFDTARIYTSKWIIGFLLVSASSQKTILDMTGVLHRMELLATSYKAGATDFIDSGNNLRIKSLAGGGFRLRNDAGAARFVCGYIYEMRNITGTGV